MINNAMDSLYGVNDDEVDEEEDRVLFEGCSQFVGLMT